MPISDAIILIVVMLIFGFANCFFGKDIFRPLLFVYGFFIGAALVGGVAQATETEPSIVAVFITGGILALLSIAVFYVGIAVLGAVVGGFAITLIANAIGSQPAPLLLIVVACSAGGLALVFSHYVVMFATALMGAMLVSQAIYLFFPDTIARFDFTTGLQFSRVSTGAVVIGSIIVVVLTIAGGYMQYQSFKEHGDRDY